MVGALVRRVLAGTGGCFVGSRCRLQKGLFCFLQRAALPASNYSVELTSAHTIGEVGPEPRMLPPPRLALSILVRCVAFNTAANSEAVVCSSVLGASNNRT